MTDVRRTRVHAYAVAMLEVAGAEGNLDTVEDELFKVARAIQGNDALRESLTDQRLAIEVRQGIVEDLLGGRALPTTTALVSFVVGAGRARDLPDIIDELVNLAGEARAEAVATVTSAIALDEATTKKLAKALTKRFGHKVAVKVVVDPDIVGGLITQIGDTVIDGSVRTRLEQLRTTF